jgi:hypothetical protein
MRSSVSLPKMAKRWPLVILGIGAGWLALLESHQQDTAENPL